MENNESIKDLTGAEAGKKIKELAEAAHMCSMITSLDKRPFSVRPMAIQKADENGSIYFLSDRRSDKNKELLMSTEMHLIIMNSKSSEYLTLYGTAQVYADQKQIEEMYSQFANTWFDGKKDPNITVIRFDPTMGHYWDTRHGKMVQLAGIILGAITGKQSDDGVEGELRVGGQ